MSISYHIMFKGCARCLIGGAFALLTSHLGAEEFWEATPIRVYADQEIGTIKRNLAGVAIGGSTDTFLEPKAVAAMKEMGVRYVRLEGVTGDSRGLYDPATGQYSWARLDQEIENIHSIGAEIIADLFYMPRFLSMDPKAENYWIFPPKDYEAWGRYVQAIVHHVNIEKKYGIKYWEVWNEPSGGGMFRDYNQNYWRLYQAASAGVKAADPVALVGGIGDNPNYPENFQTFFNYVKKKDMPLDFLSIHWYGEWVDGKRARPSLYRGFASALDAYSEKTFHRKFPMFITEWNLPAEGPVPEPGRAAAYMAESFYWMQNSPIEVACFFRPQVYRDTKGSMLDANNEWRTLGRVFKMFSSLPETEINVTNYAEELMSLAAKDDRRVCLFISRYSSGSTAIQQPILLAGLSGKTNYKLRIYTENGATEDQIGVWKPINEIEGKVSSTGTIETSVTLPPYSVAYVEVEFSSAKSEK